jgi:transposase
VTGSANPDSCKERRLEPQITIGLLTDAAGFPLMVNAVEGTTRDDHAAGDPGVPTAHHLPDVTIVADAGMVSAANQKAIEAAGLLFILGARIP